ncbi:DUF397 domain-containing protein [Streptomyces yanii]|uniref:DUF397 domain-containing protein n=1 Tax=Streptomyces yanii TaxID=78510 RepID=A0ABV5RGX1_9ACTN
MSIGRATSSSEHLVWFKSSYSGSDGDNCVEVAVTHEVVRVRDSKETGQPGQRDTDTSWTEFVAYACG